MAAGPSGKSKLDNVKQLLGVLEEDLAKKTLSDGDRSSKLEQLKIYGRDPRDADPIFAPESVEILCQFAFGEQSLKTSREAMRCLANTFLLRPKLVQTFVEHDFCGKAADCLKSREDDDEFLLCRILFLTTYGSKADFPMLVEKHDLARSIKAHLLRHDELIISRKEGQVAPPMENMALSENLKLIYNVTHHHPDLIPSFNPSLEILSNLLSHITLPTPPLQPPITFLINAISQLDFETRDNDSTSSTTLFITSDTDSPLNRLIIILDASLSLPASDLETLASPLILVLRKIYSTAPNATKQYLQTTLLPPATDRDLPLGQSSSLSSRLLRLTTNAMTPNLREAISGMYFELSSQDPTTFVNNIGYGFASGYLMSHNIAVPSLSTDPTNNTNSSTDPINPVTGQRLSAEPTIDPSAGMTEEEKEREAERLFVLFERLRATGAVNVENPVARAMREGGGRVEEVEDSEDSD